MRRETCKLCGDTNRVGFTVPDHIWEAATAGLLADRPGAYPYVLCLRDFTRLADEAGLEWDVEIEFYPVSLVSHWKGCSVWEGRPDLVAAR